LMSSKTNLTSALACEYSIGFISWAPWDRQAQCDSGAHW
jgi:hypothetical protein